MGSSITKYYCLAVDNHDEPTLAVLDPALLTPEEKRCVAEKRLRYLNTRYPPRKPLAKRRRVSKFD
jgi:hypothetical protein